MPKLWEDSEIEVDDFGDEHVRNPLVRDTVPWKRCGHPLWRRTSPDKGEYKWGREVANVGIFPERLFTDEYITGVWKHHSVGVEERAFAEMWDYDNNGCGGTSKVISIVNAEPISSMIKSPDDWKLVQLVAQTIVQWLGTNCGSCFVDEARKLAQFDKDRFRLIVDPKGVERDIEWARTRKPVHTESDMKFREEKQHQEIEALKAKHASELATIRERHRKELLDEIEAQRVMALKLAERVGSTSRLIEV